ncbi:MAG: SBBP repeat-containing protein [Candidatus Sumerlaeota bacterium]|nr:SBBP repeat-containing protein [Candidatus Sumerlaeota bacterium]
MRVLLRKADNPYSEVGRSIRAASISFAWRRGMLSRKRRLVSLLSFLALLLVMIAPANEAGEAVQPAVDESFGKLPVYFVENGGRMDQSVAYYVQGQDKTLYFTPGGVTFALTGRREGSESTERWVVRLEFLDANPNARPEGQDPAEATISYFKGKPSEWRSGLHTYGALVYRDLWPGIDLVYRGTVSRLKYEFVVRPGADPARIRMAYRGATSVSLNSQGQLEVATPLGGFHDDTPVAYSQKAAENKQEVAVCYRLAPCDGAECPVIDFEVGAYDPCQTLVLDPAMVVYCGYIGSAQGDAAHSVAVGPDGSVYVAGHTYAPSTGFPTKTGPDLSQNGDIDAFVAKVNPSGASLVYCGFIGGGSSDYANDVAIDSLGNAYVVGQTNEPDSAFPVTVGPDLTANGWWEAFIAKVSPTGATLQYCGYIGGAGYDSAQAVAVDANGNAFVTGYTNSSETSFPVKTGPDMTYNGGSDWGDAFVAKVNSSGTGLAYCGYIGGAGNDYGVDICLDSSGRAYVGGGTPSSESTFPVKVGPDLTFNGGEEGYGNGDGFVAKISATGNQLVYCGYIGGADGDQVHTVNVDTTFHLIIGGVTSSSEATFPVIGGPDLTYNGAGDLFLGKVTENGSALEWCGYFGGADEEYNGGVRIGNAGSLYVFGTTKSSEATFPVKSGPDLTYNGGYDGFVARLREQGFVLDWCGYLGGALDEWCLSAAVLNGIDVYVGGETQSPESSFPVKVGPDLIFNGAPPDSDGFIAKIAQPGAAAQDHWLKY